MNREELGVAVDETLRKTSKGSRKDWEHDASSARRATPRDILRLHLKEREVLARASEL